MEGNTCKIGRWQVLKAQLNNLSPEEFQEMIERTPGAVVIDVRTWKEYSESHLPGAINIDYLAYDFWERMEALDPRQTYFVYCRSGRRSVRTCTLMKNGGFHLVYNLDGGLNIWQEVFGKQRV